MSRDKAHTPKRSGLLRRFGTRSTQLVAKTIGDWFPFYYVCEYPRSGGTWLGQMIGDYLGLPLPHQPQMPVLRSAVIHNHWGFSPRLRKVFYLHRDGRDVCTSMYFFCLRAIHHENRAMRNYYRSKLPQNAPKDWTPESSFEHMPEFIEIWAQNPMGCRITWGDHVRQFTSNREHVVTLSYESLRTACLSTLLEVLPHHVDGEIDQTRLSESVEKFSFAKVAGRQPGEEDASSFMRKGIVGDWQNHFSRRAGEIFDRHFGEQLLSLGYVENREWFEHLPEPPKSKSCLESVAGLG